jgi:ABC-2 type transport system ATP-binding protein
MRGSNNDSNAFNALNSSSQAYVQVENLSKSFGSLEAVSSVSFTVDKGTIFGLVGSDGAGKTTLLRMIATMTKPTAGSIVLNGMNVLKDKTKVKDLIGYMPQRFGLYQDLTVGENLDFFLDIFGVFGVERQKRRDQYLGFSNLLDFIDRQAGDLSGGMKQKLGLACVLVHKPKILILDEPTNGVDPVSRQEFWDILAEMKREGMTILISTAYLDEGEKCDRLILLHRSKAVDLATPQEIQAHFPDLEAAMIHRIEEVDKGLIRERFKA